MASTPTVTTPDFTGTIDTRAFLAPLGGPQHPISYLDRFPDDVYTKAIDSRLVRFMYSLMGPAGVGWLRKNYLDARLMLEDHGFEVFDLDKFYGDPIAFGRILEEVYETDPSGLLPRDQWETIRAKDSAYRNRAIDFVSGARAGNTPFGMHLVARSGLGHEVEIIENYKYLYDQVTDDRLSLKKYGVSNSMNEFVVLPRQELPQNEVQTVTITGYPTGGTFQLYLPLGNTAAYQSAAIAYNAHRSVVQAALELVSGIGKGNVTVDGGPLPNEPITITFRGALANTDLPQLQAISALTGGSLPNISVLTTREGKNSTTEIVAISPRDKYHLKQAVDRIKPVATFVSFALGGGTTSRQVWNTTMATSEYHEVLRYVVGNTGVAWPARDLLHWIEPGIERQAPRMADDLSHHYQGFHNITRIESYDDTVAAHDSYLTDLSLVPRLANNHMGTFSAYQRAIFPVLGARVTSDFAFSIDRATADYTEPLTVTVNSGTSSANLVNGLYPVDYQDLPGVPPIKYKEEQFWASKERAEGSDYIEIDLGSVQAVNYVYFEITDKPVQIDLSYDILDLMPEREFVDATYDADITSTRSIGYRLGNQTPWNTAEIHFTNPIGCMVYARILRIKLTRRPNPIFTLDDGTLVPFSIEVRNLRVGRNVV
jgi:hypothetical protein